MLWVQKLQYCTTCGLIRILQLLICVAYLDYSDLFSCYGNVQSVKGVREDAIDSTWAHIYYNYPHILRALFSSHAVTQRDQ